jgi:hypothetical protein
MASTSSSGSESESSNSRSSSAARRRDRRERKRERRRAKGSKREKREKRDSSKRESSKERREKKRKREKKGRRHKREKEQVQRSIITGKRIHRRDGDVADAEGEARRAALLAHMNEGEGVVWEGPAAAAAASSRRGADRAIEQARSDPALMRRLVEQGQEALASKRQRLGALARSEADGYTGQ